MPLLVTIANLDLPSATGAYQRDETRARQIAATLRTTTTTALESDEMGPTEPSISPRPSSFAPTSGRVYPSHSGYPMRLGA